VENEYLPQVAAAGEVARVEEVQMTRRRRRERARCKCAGGGKGGYLENAKAAATQSSVYIKPALLRSRLSLLPSCPCLSRAARMDQDQSPFLVITYSQGWIDG